MKWAFRLSVLLCLAVATPLAPAQPGPPRADDDVRRMRREMREFMAEQREQWREEHRARREAWLRMSPEDRHQLRRDIREAGRDLYPQRHHRHRD